MTPLGIAAAYGNTEALEILIQHGKTLKYCVLYSHLSSNNDCSPTIVLTPQNLLYSPYAPLGGDVNAKASNGDTVLYDAAGSGNLDSIELLLQHGANPNVASYACQLPIHRAAYEGHIL